MSKHVLRFMGLLIVAYAAALIFHLDIFEIILWLTLWQVTNDE